MDAQVRRRALLSVSAVAMLLAASFSASAEGLKGQLYLTPGVEKYYLLVKFNASTSPDLDASNRLIFRHRAPPAKTTIQQSALSMKFRRVVKFSPDDLARIKSGVQSFGTLPGKVDMLQFSGMMYMEVPGADKNHLLQLGQELETLNYVEYCSLEPVQGPPPPSVDITPTTPDYTSLQGWTGPNPGADLRYCWSVGGLGQGITVRDIEDSWGNLDHEDFSPAPPDLAYVLPRYSDTYAFHGISIFGMIFAQHNGYGVYGGAPGAVGRCYSFQTSTTTQDRPAAMTSMIADSKRGDVLLLEMQSYGPDGNLCPADIDQTIWDLTKKATDSGVVVVGTAGNGGANMDGTAYDSYRARGDNGVIMAGAGSGDTQHNRLSFSSYGTPVHIQGWGENVVTTSCNSAGCLTCADLANLPTGNPDGHQGYTSTFNGTSSGGGMTAGVVAAFQSYAMLKLGRFLAPTEMRNILISTGIPQGTGTTGHIGPLPNLLAAIHWVDSLYAAEVVPRIIKNEITSYGLFYNNGAIHYLVPGSAANRMSQVTLSLFDLKGSLVRILLNEQKSPGRYRIDLHKANVSAGIFLCTMTVADNKYTARIVLR